MIELSNKIITSLKKRRSLTDTYHPTLLELNQIEVNVIVAQLLAYLTRIIYRQI